MKTFTRYYNAVSYLEGLSNMPLKGDYLVQRQNLGVYLKRMRYFLDLLGNPDKGMKYIHITGTAGKGSVTNMVHEIIHASGKKVGSFTSPFVTTTIEKIKVEDLYIDPNEFADIVEYLKPYIDHAYVYGPYGRPSYFEICFALAIIHFKRMKCEWVVLEVGLGGRYDATNVIEKPVITAITNIDYDHTAVLGKTLQKIAYDKAGIIKKGSIFCTSEQRPQILSLFKILCNEHNVPFNLVPKQICYEEYNKKLATLITQKIGINDIHIQKGIHQSRLQCRFEVMQEKPLVILDGAHNRSKIRSTITNLKIISYKKLHVIIGISEGKDSEAILKQIIPLADSVSITRFQIRDRKCAHPKVLSRITRKYLKNNSCIATFLDPTDALSMNLKNAGSRDLVLVVGSFFLAGELRKMWILEEEILKHRKSFF